MRFFSGAAQQSHKKQATARDETATTAAQPKANEAGAGQSPGATEAAEKPQEASHNTRDANSGWPSPFEGLIDAPPQAVARFFERVLQIMKTLNITDDPANLLPVLKKIEDQTNSLIEERDFLVIKQRKEGMKGKDEELLEKFEDRCRREGKELIFKAKQKLEAEKAKAKKEAARLKSEQDRDKILFSGKKIAFRSEKKRFKAVVKKVDNSDQQTKDEKEYLGD